MNMTIDGFISGPDCELGWHFECWTTQMGEFLCDQLEKADTILLGRRTYEGMAQYWGEGKDPAIPLEGRVIRELMNRHKKVVFSNTLRDLRWNNTIVIKGDPVAQIQALKTSEGKNIIVYGSGQLAQALVEKDLADEYHLWVHPVALGKGKSLFTSLNKFSLHDIKTFRSGVVVLVYSCCK